MQSAQRKLLIVDVMCLYRVEGDGFFTGGKDNKIYKVDLLGNPIMCYEGHEGAINSISQSVKEEFVSGSWDG